MKTLKQIFQGLIGIVALICTALVACGRLAYQTIRKWWKRRSKWFCRLVKVSAVIAAVGFAGLMAYAFYDSRYGRWSWNDEPLTDNIMLHYFQDDKARVYNCTTGKYTTGRLNWVAHPMRYDSLTVYAVPGRRGYININTGEIVIDARSNDYTKAWVFSEGLAAVMKDGKIGFINPSNEVVIPFQYASSEKCDLWKFAYIFYNGYSLMTDRDGDFGIIDKTGKWIIEPEYKEIWKPGVKGHRVIMKDGKYGLIDAYCNFMYPVEYDHIESLNDGFVLSRCGCKWKVDLDGNVVNDMLFDSTHYLNYPVGYDEYGDIRYEFADYLKYKVGDLFGIMDRITGDAVTPAIYVDINMLSEELFEVQDQYSGEWYLLDTNGKVMSKK